MVGVLRHQYVGKRPFGRNRPFDEMRWRGRLEHPLFADPAGVLGAHGDDDSKLRRDDVEPLGAVLADAHHLTASARALRALGLEHPLDARQMLGKMAEVALRGWAPRTRFAGRARRGLCLGLGERAFERLEGELELVGVQLLRFACEQRPAKLAQQMLQALVVLGERGHLVAKALDHCLGLAPFEHAIAFHKRRVLGAKRLKRRSLCLELRPVRTGRRAETNGVSAHLHDRILS